MKKIRDAESRVAALRLGALQVLFAFFFAFIAAGAGLSDDAADATATGLSAPVHHTHSAILTKKDAARAHLTADRRQGSKSRWSDPLDAVLPQLAAISRHPATELVTPRKAADAVLASSPLVFQARAPPRLTA